MVLVKDCSSLPSYDAVLCGPSVLCLLVDNMNEVLAALLRVREDAETGNIHHPRAGICRNLAHILLKGAFATGSGAYQIVEELSRTWPERALHQCTSYPVPHEYGVPMWEGKNLARRLSLIDHMIEQIRAGYTYGNREAIYNGN